MSQKGTITTYESGADLVVEWKIENFFNPSMWDPASYYSPDFAFGGEEWFLEIYPDGSSGSDSSEHVDLRLFKYDSDRSIEQSFSLSLKTVKGEKYNEQHVTNYFDDDNGFHEFNRFIPRTELSKRRSDLAADGNLTVICTMKNTTPARSDRDEVPTAEVNTSSVAGSAKSAASGSSQSGMTTTKESVLKWNKENCKEASKGKKRKLKEENVLKGIEENYKKASKGRKRKLEEENNDGSLCQDF